MNQKSKINTKKKNKNIRVKKQGDFALPEETKPNQVFELLWLELETLEREGGRGERREGRGVSGGRRLKEIRGSRGTCRRPTMSGARDQHALGRGGTRVDRWGRYMLAYAASGSPCAE